MKFLLDVHISFIVSKILQSIGYETIHVNSLPNKWYSSDAEITKFADENEMILISKDQDFLNSYLINKKPFRLLKINLGNISNKDLIELIHKILPELSSFYTTKHPFCIELNHNSYAII